MSEPRFSLVLFGPPLVKRIEADGREVELAWRLRKALHAVLFLAVQPDRRASRDHLIDAVWGEASHDNIQKNLHPTLTDARRTLGGEFIERGGLILLNHGIYVLSSEAEWILDTETYRQRIEIGRAMKESEAERALEIWLTAWKMHRGLFLDGFEAPWIGRWRDDLRREHLALLQDIGQLATELDQLTLALDAYRSVLFDEPFEEFIHIKVMELYARQGRRDLVRKQYVRLQEHLKELDVEPLAETQACYQRLMW